MPSDSSESPRTPARAGPVPSGPRPPSPLDPPDWGALSDLLHAAADRLVEHVSGQHHGPVWREMPEAIAAGLLEPISADGLGEEGAWRLLEERVLPYGVGNVHPRFMGWVHGAGTAGGLLAGMAEAAMNANLGGRNSGAARVEGAVLEWARTLFGFPEGASGVLTSGTSMATIVALAAARNAAADWDVETDGLGAEGARFRLYTSAAAHSCVAGAMRVLGFGTSAVVTIPTDARGRMRIDALRDAIRRDRDSDLRPFAVVGSAGTVDFGAFDPLGAIADVAEAEGLWFHVDGAFGALVRLSPSLRDRVDGIERADSLAFDFHKWLHVTYDCGCVLVRDEEHHRAAFAGRPRYLEGQAEGLAAGDVWFCDYGPELSRGFRALRVWYLLVEQGTDALAAAIDGSVARAAHLAARVDREPDLERLAPAELQIVCFRVRPREGEDADALNAKVVAELQLRGIAAPSTTRIDGALVIRCCILNHRSTDADMDAVVDAVLEISVELRERGFARRG